MAEERSNYWQKHIAPVLKKGIRNPVIQAVGLDYTVDDQGRKHFYRPSRHLPSVPAIPKPPPGPGVPIPVQDGVFSTPDYISRNGMNHPATRKCLTDMYVNMEGHWGKYVIRILELLNPGVDSRRFNSWLSSLFNGTRAFDNGHPYGSGDWALENLFCSGFTGRRYSPVEKQAGRFRAVYIPVRAINPRIYLPLPTRLDQIDMTLHFFATTATLKGNNPFPQFGGRVVIPFFGAEVDNTGQAYNWVERDGNPDRPGPMRPVTSIQHPFEPAHYDLTAGLRM